jgi:hypothetical protein
MTQKITLELSDSLTQKIRTIAVKQQQSLEELLINLIEQGASKLPLELLSDAEILSLCDQQMSEQEQVQLSELLAKQREETLNGNERQQLTNLMQIYRQGLIQKAKATQIAVERKLHPPLNYSQIES